MSRYIILVFFFCFSFSAKASVDLSTLNLASDGVVPLGYNLWLASAISSDPETANADLRLDAITLRIKTVVPNANLFVGVTTSEFFVPNMSNVVAIMNVDPLTLDPLLNTLSEVRLVPSAATPNPILTSGQDYWLVVGVTAPDPGQEDLPTGLYCWSYAPPGSPIEGIAGWGIPSKIANAGTAGATWSPSSETPFSFALETTSIFHESPSQVWLEVAERIANKNDATPAQILVHREGSLSSGLTVSLASSGQALAGSDYSPLPTTITFEPAQAVVTLEVTPLSGAVLLYGAEDVILSVLTDADYFLGDTTEARVVIVERLQTLNKWIEEQGVVGDHAVILADDSDQDGLTGLAEFAFGGSLSLDDRILLSPDLLRHSDGRFGLEVRRWPSVPELRYRLQTSGDLQVWDAVPAEDYEESDHEILENGIEALNVFFRSKPESSALFYRIKVEHLN